MNEIQHVLGISGGKDSAALAVYLTLHYPQLPMQYYFMDTGKELDETYTFIDNLEVFLGKQITRLQAAKGSPMDPFDHYLTLYGNYLPSVQARWCTRKLKLEPFEQFFVGDVPAISYVAIRGDEDREGYISHKPNIQTIFPFRRNIWSKDVLTKVFAPEHRIALADLYGEVVGGATRAAAQELVNRPATVQFTQARRLTLLLDLGVATFNHVVFGALKQMNYPMSRLDDFPLLDNEDVVDRDGVFRLLDESGVGMPQYYEPIEFEHKGQKGLYNRSRSGCYFCFFQQKIEWVWLYEQHPERFTQAMAYEKDGYTWMDDESLADLIQPERISAIKEQHLRTSAQATKTKSAYLLDVLDESEGEGCAACFI
ncbi:MAG: phosphoadenosine phosphosulfate reductase family protein [Caldilineaceae bacterium]|nr:phosphoadenosine phosphosulfate reductase family protein [Caldilineaceae bacterium]